MTNRTVSLKVLFIYIRIQVHLVLNVKDGESHTSIFISFPSEASQKWVNLLSSFCINEETTHYFASLGYRLVLQIAYLVVRFSYVGL